jgi:hypothetical protein
MYFSRLGHSVGAMDNFAKRRWELELNVKPLIPIRTLHALHHNPNLGRNRNISQRGGACLFLPKP